MENNLINPIMNSYKAINDGTSMIDINMRNISKYFSNIFVLIKKDDDPIPLDFYNRNINENILTSMKNRLVIWSVSVNIVKNEKHFDKIEVVKKENIKDFNQFSFQLNDYNVILPIFNISFKNFFTYLNNFEGITLEKVYNNVILSNYFSDNLYNVKNNLQLSKLINSMEESSYWELPYNCSSNLTNNFKNRSFIKSFSRKVKEHDLTITKYNNDNKNYDFDKISKSKKFVDASNIVKENGIQFYVPSKPSIYSKDEIYQLLETLDPKNRFSLFCNLIVSKKYCAITVNNEKVLTLMEHILHTRASIFTYMLGYTWLKLYFEESIKKRNLTSQDEIIFDINAASKLPVYPFGISCPKTNPYMPIMVDDDTLNPGFNIGSVKNFVYNANSKEYLNQGICNLDEFKTRMNLFISRKRNTNLFMDVEWVKWKVAIAGSIMAACIQRRHPLVNIFYNEDFDSKFIRFFNEYYATADIDVMFLHNNIFEYLDAVNQFYKQIVINTRKIYYTLTYSDSDVMLKKMFQLNFSINEDWVKTNIVNNDITFDYVYRNVETEEIKKLFEPHINECYNKYLEDQLKDYTEEQKEKLKVDYPDYFLEVKNFDVKINICLDKEYFNPNDKVKINYKYMIMSKHYDHNLEIFKVSGTDHMNTVSQFHLPCVRAFYNGENVYMTPSCVSAHLTYMNLDYKYFAGSKEPMDIINKYRMRGFGTWLNQKEIKELLEYSTSHPFWSNLYGTNKNSTNMNVGNLSFKHKLFHPRLINGDEYYNAAPVNLENGYKDKFDDAEIKTDINKELSKGKFDNNCKKFGIGVSFISTDGSIIPFQKWVIDAYATNITEQDYKNVSTT